MRLLSHPFNALVYLSSAPASGACNDRIKRNTTLLEDSLLGLERLVSFR